jgi:hypothetical protein
MVNSDELFVWAEPEMQRIKSDRRRKKKRERMK